MPRLQSNPRNCKKPRQRLAEVRNSGYAFALSEFTGAHGRARRKGSGIAHSAGRRGAGGVFPPGIPSKPLIRLESGKRIETHGRISQVIGAVRKSSGSRSERKCKRAPRNARCWLRSVASCRAQSTRRAPLLGGREIGPRPTIPCRNWPCSFVSVYWRSGGASHGRAWSERRNPKPNRDGGSRTP